MNYLKIFFVVLFYNTISFCHSHEDLSPESSAGKIQDHNAETATVNRSCTLLFGSMFLERESLKRRYYMSQLDITGSQISFSDIPPANFCEGQIVVIQIFATDVVIIDRDYDSQGLDVTLVIAAPLIRVIGEDRKIILNGYNGQEHKTCAELGSPHGAHGREGDDGGHGGYFYAVAENLEWIVPDEKEKKSPYYFCTNETPEFTQFIRCQDDNMKVFNQNTKPSLKIYLNGGKGSAGQDGGHGAPGRDGTAFNLSTAMIDKDGNVKDFNVSLRKEVPAPQNETHLGNGTSQVILGNKATDGGKGGNGGPGGKGGEPGGLIFVIFSLMENCNPKSYDVLNVDFIKGKRGVDGEHGQFGVGGRAGTPGTDIRLNVYVTENRTIELREVEYYEHVPPFIGRDGLNGTKSDKYIFSEGVSRLHSFSRAVSFYTVFLQMNFDIGKETGKQQKRIYDIIDDCKVKYCLAC